MDQSERDGRRQVSSTFLVALLDYVERACGPGAVDDVLAAAGRGQTRSAITSAKWCRRDEIVAVAEAAAQRTGDPDLGRRAGEEMFRKTMSNPAARASFLSRGDPAGAVAAALEYTLKMGRGRTYRIVSSDAAGCVIEGRYESPGRGHPFFCGLALGYWPLLASVFDAVGTGTHPDCQCRGDAVCRFEIRWDPGASADTTQVDAAGAELRRRIKTFEQMQSVAEDLARAADLPALAERILDAVDGITLMPSLLVAVRARDDGSPVVAARGLADRKARWMAEILLGGGTPEGTNVVSKAPLGRFGVVAAVSPDSRSASDPSTSLLEAFARHAGARVEAVVSRQLAEESRQTANALLRLAGSLAQATTEGEVSRSLARAIPELVGADHSAVLRWHPERCSLKTVAHVGPADKPPFGEFTVTEVPTLYEMAARPIPFVLDRTHATGYIADAMANWDEQLDVIVPLVAQGDFLGFLCAGYRTRLHLDRDTAFARLQGAADLAATSFAKAQLLEEIRHQALHDELTGLPNRVLLEHQVRQALREARRHGHHLALLFVDLDRFKKVNDSLGHKFGDTLIQAAAERIAGCLRDSDIFARMGGDEFVIVLTDTQPTDGAAHVAGKILEDLRRPFEIAGRTLYVSASIGVASYPEDGSDYGALLQSADSAMYAAKGAGRNTISRHGGPAVADGRSRLSLETELHRAVETDQIRVAYQPQVAMADLKLLAVEALVRWDHPRLREMPPSEFLPLAEECGLIPRLDRVVRRKAFRQARAWQEAVGPLVVAVNLGAASIRRPELLSEMASDIRESGVDPTRVEVELTEGMVGEDDLIPVVNGLADMGLRVAIDDFGTGASVFARLRRLPLHTLKIDRSLVQAEQAGRDSSILEAIIDMSHSLGLNVVAEGVERPAQAGLLRRAGCDAGQGFLFGRPTTPEEIEKAMYFQLTNLDRPAFALPAEAERGRASSADLAALSRRE